MKIYGDFLTRKQMVEDISSIIRSCVGMEKPITFSVEGEWGKGKTWIVEKVADTLNGIDVTLEEDSRTKKAGVGDFLVFNYNAWEKDYYEEPLLAILITLINQLNKQLILENIVKSELKVLYEESKAILETALRAISKRVIGIDVVDIGKRGIEIAKRVKNGAKLETEADYSENNIEKDIHTVVSTLNKLSQQTPVVFIVDELDRCLPEHTIRTLERLHHIFGKVHSSVTVISVNEAQLKTTVLKMFGDNIPFEAYLRKFVDFRVSLDSGNADSTELQVKLKTFFDLFGQKGDDKLLDEVVSGLCNSMTARDFEKVCNNATLCHKLVGKETAFLSKDLACAELLLFACKIAIEKEKGQRACILPIYMNDPKSDLGKFINNYFSVNIRPVTLRLSTSKEKIHYICMKGLLTSKEMEQNYKITATFVDADMENFYEEYLRLYKLIK